MKKHIPKTELLAEYLKQALINGDISNGAAQEVSVLMMDSAHESAEIIQKICEEEIEKLKYSQLWFGFGLGVISTLVIAAVVFAAIHNFN